jgi:DNA-binding transcriptional LysR family regulator
VPLSRITLRQYEACIAVADALGFAAAGERLGLTSSAVSQLVAELESALGFRLFDRTTRRVALSSAGREFIASARAVLRQASLAESAAADVRNRAAGVVRIGAPLTLAGFVLPAAVRDFGERHPKVVVRIHDLAVDALVDGVAAGDVDLAVGPDRVVESSVRREPAFSSPWVLWCSSGHALAGRRALQWDDLRNVALVAAGRDHERSVERMHANAPEGTRIDPVNVVDNVTTALGIAAQGLAATLAPAYVGVIARPLGLKMKRVLRPEVQRQVCLYWPVARSSAPAAQAFGEFLAGWLRRWHAAQEGRRR